MGQAPSAVDPPPWSLNAPYAKHRKPPGAGNPVQNGRLPHIQSSDVIHTDSDLWPVSFVDSGPQ